MDVEKQKEKYSTYRFNCHCEGDIWNADNEPYSFKEWLEKGQPEHGGKPYKKVIYNNISKHA